MMTGPFLACIHKLAVQHFTHEVYNLFTKATTLTPIFRLLLVMHENYLNLIYWIFHLVPKPIMSQSRMVYIPI